MLGLRGKLSLSARRHGFAGSGLTSTSILLAALLLSACQVPQHQLKLAAAGDKPAPAATETATPSTQDALPKQTPLAATPAVARGDAILPTSLSLTGDPKELLGL